MTEQQSKLLAFIEGYIADHGEAQAFRDIHHSGIIGRSMGEIHAAVQALEDDGHIRRLPGRARAMEVVRCEWVEFFTAEQVYAARDAGGSV